MNESNYRIVVGITIVIGLFFDLGSVMLMLVGISLLEGISSQRLTVLLWEWKNHVAPPINFGCAPSCVRFDFDSERAVRLLVAIIITLTYFVFRDHAWYLTWFLGFAMIGAGISGVCPMSMTLEYLGFKRSFF